MIERTATMNQKKRKKKGKTENQPDWGGGCRIKNQKSS
jgi:hypothetical protein